MGAKLITKLDLIERYGKDRAQENMRFRAFVKHRLALDDETLDGVVRESAEAVWQQIDCTACAQCCKTLAIVVDGEDIRRLAARLGISPRAFERRYVRRRGSEMELNRQPCPFLQGGVCSVYEDRPTACRDFPYLHSPGFRNRMLLMVENSILCPIVFNTLERLKRRLRRPGG